MSEFHWEIRHFRTVADFRGYLAMLARPSWVKGATIHHTWAPTPKQWNGQKTMEGLARFYQNERKWDRGPHLFLCAGGAKPELDGIWTGTPLHMTGIHAGVCNSTHVGIEIVGDYDTNPWSDETAELVYSTLEALCVWGGFDHTKVNGHRECLPNKTCPGKMITMDNVRLTLARRRDRTIVQPRILTRREETPAMPTTPVGWNPAIPFNSNAGVEITWLARQGSTRPWGKPLTPKFTAPNGQAMMLFEHAIVTWDKTNKITEWWK